MRWRYGVGALDRGSRARRRNTRSRNGHRAVARTVAAPQAMSEDSRREVRTGLDPCLARLWRYALVLTGTSDTAEDLVQATCLRAVERADRFVPGTRLDRWLFAILRSIGLNEIRAQRISEGGGFIDADDRLRTRRAPEGGTT